MWFFDQYRRGIPAPGVCVNICGEEVQVGLQMKYPGLMIDSQWTVGPQPTPYAAYYQTLAEPKSKFVDCMREWLHRITTIRIVRGYRTISHASASALVASPPFELQALALRRVYNHLQDLCSGGDTPSADQSVRDVREEARLETWERWRRGYDTPSSKRWSGPTELGGLKRWFRAPADVQDDAGSHRAQSVRGVPAKDSAGGD
ncbi:uncharacterized protein [Bombus flavifrons]|uniref:uncharacterized protein n=1 Tax=Bombus flavifrons TaxID=103934 RepID=UPI003703925E